jgi:hypothetical protein
MDVESQLRDALDINRVPGEPGFGFEERVIRSLPDRSRRRVRFVPAFVGLAVVLAIVAVVAPWYLGCTNTNGPAGVSASPSEPSTTAIAIPAPTPDPTAVTLTHARSWGLEFDYPASWRLSDAPSIVVPKALQSLTPVAQGNYYVRRVFGYVGTNTPETVCSDPVNQKPGMWSLGVCSSVWSLGPNDAVLRFQKGDIGGRSLESWPTDPSFAMTTVGGLPALFRQSSGSGIPGLAMSPSPVAAPEIAAGADTVLVWQLPGNPTGGSQPIPVRIVAAVRGPDVAAIVSQVKAVVGSIKDDPAVVPLPTDPAARTTQSLEAVTRALGYPFADSRTLDCFPRVPGSRDTTVTFTPSERTLSKPLPVTCSVAVEPNPMEGWTVTLTVTWQGASDRRAGLWTANIYIDQQGGTIIPGDSAEFPYEVPSSASPG